jgi:hypothetical protein
LPRLRNSFAPSYLSKKPNQNIIYTSLDSRYAPCVTVNSSQDQEQENPTHEMIMGGYTETVLPGSSPSALFTTVILSLLGLLWLVVTREATPLRKVPGPFLASITKLWIVRKQRGYQRPLVDMDLHKRYGPIVRIAPNEVLISSPQAFRTVYGKSCLSPRWIMLKIYRSRQQF